MASHPELNQSNEFGNRVFSRRNILKGGVGLGAAGLLTAAGVGCGGDDDDATTPIEATNTIPPTATEVVPTATSTPEVTPIPEPTGLRKFAAERGIKIGVQTTDFTVSEKTTAEIVNNEFNVENISQAYWGGANSDYRELRPSRGRFDFQYVDPGIEFAKNHGLDILAMHLIWGQPKALPYWMVQNNYSNSDLQEIVDEHIKTVMTHFRENAGTDKSITWSVVNEYFPFAQYNFWYAKLGEEFLPVPFRKAREADPKAILMLNNFDNHTFSLNANTDYPRAQRLKQEGILDTYGMQMHLKGEAPPNIDEFKRNIDRFQKLGLDVVLSEMDVDMSKYPGTAEEKDARQAQIFKDILTAYFSMGGKYISIYGINDSSSWLGSESRATIFDGKNNPKPSHEAVLEAIQSVPKTSGS